MPAPAPGPEALVAVLASLNLNGPLQAPLTPAQTAIVQQAVQQVLSGGGVSGVQNVTLTNTQVGLACVGEPTACQLSIHTAA